MKITFDTENFRGGAKSLTIVLETLRRWDSWDSGTHKDVETICCRTPSDALRYVTKVGCKLSPEAEKVFLKNVGLGIRYLKYKKNRYCTDTFYDKDFHQKFVKKIKRNPQTALEWAKTHGRLTEKEEEVFLKDFPSLRTYAMNVIKGAFPDKMHHMILLKSFDASLDSWQKKWLKEYVSFVERINKNELTPLDQRIMTQGDY